MSLSMQIRAYLESDEGAVVQLWHACGLTRTWNDPHKDIARKLTVQRALFFVGEMDATIVATVMAGFEGHRGWISYLAVAPELRGRGYGRALMTAAEEHLTELGCPKVNLLVRSANTAAMDFYGRLGYVADQAIPLGKRLIADAPSP